MDFNILSILAVIVVAFLAGMERGSGSVSIPPTNYCLFSGRASNWTSQRMYYLGWSLAIDCDGLG